MRVVFFGTPDFAVGVLRALCQSKHTVLAVVAQPDRAKDRKGNLLPVATKSYALEKGIDVFQFEKIKDAESIKILKSIDCDIMVTAAYGQILNREILDIAPRGIVNVHASLLPKYRGASPVQSSILNGDTETGVTIMRTEEGLDTGDIISYKKVQIGENENSVELLERLSEMGGELLVETLSKMEEQEIIEQKQDESQATKCRLLKKEDGLVEWKEPSAVIHNKVRALISWPTAYTHFGDKMLKIFETERIDDLQGNPGEVISAGDDGIVVACGNGAIKIKLLQLEGKNRMKAGDFVRGYRIKSGDFFGKR